MVWGFICFIDYTLKVITSRVIVCLCVWGLVSQHLAFEQLNYDNQLGGQLVNEANLHFYH